MNRNPSIFFSFFLFPLLVFGTDAGENGANVLDVFNLPSTQSMVVAEGKGYFPVLQCIKERLFVVFRAGGGHLGRGGRLESLWSFKNGTFHESPGVVVDGPEDDRNPAMGVTATGRVIVAYHEQGSYNPDGSYDSKNPYGRAHCRFTYSDNDGNTWVPPKPLGVAGLDSCSPYGRIIRTGANLLLLTVYGPYSQQVPGMENARNDLNYYAYLVRSHDNGETWGEPSLIGAGYNETALLLLPDGSLQAAARSIGDQRIDLSLSRDGGFTWSSFRRITGPMQHPADLLRLSNGWILLLYGDRGAEQKMIRGIVSRDEGRTWDISYTCLFSRPVTGDFGYPSAAAWPDGRIAVMYYWAGDAANSYDGGKAQARMTLFRESEWISAYQNMIH